MKLALLADLHLGHGFRRSQSNPLAEDSFRNAAEAIRIAAERADAILVAGDIFDRPDVGVHVFLRALEIFDLARTRDSGVTVDGSPWHGVPVVAIRGNHDVRADLNRHAVLMLDRAHRLKYINAERVVLEKNGEKVAVTGAGWVPDKNPDLVREFFARRVPSPVPDVFNVLMLHQPLEGIGRYPGETPLPVSNLPSGYDVYHSGHLHWHVEKRVSDRWIVIPGSTVRTQLSDREVEDDRAFWILDTETGELEEVQIPVARRGFIVRVNVSDRERSEVLSEVRQGIERALSENDRELPPIIKIVLEGSSYDVYDLSRIVSDYEGRAVVRVFDRTTSAVAEALAKISASSPDKSRDEVFSKSFALSVLEESLRAAGVDLGSAFRDLYERLVEFGKPSDRDAKERLLQKVEDLLSGAELRVRSEDGAITPETAEGGKRSGTILDWAS